MLIFLAAGLITGPGLLRETFPHAAPSEIEVNIVYPGARAKDIETAICERIEAALDAVTDLATTFCEVREGLGRAVATMRDGGDFRGFLADVTAEVDTITDFPDHAEPAAVHALALTDVVASVAVTGPEHRPTLEACAEQLRTRMLRWGGVAMVDIRGFPTSEIRIDVAPAALRRFDVLRVVPAVMLFVLTISLIEAFLILPHHLLHSLEHPCRGRVAARIEAGIGSLRDWTGRLADLMISARCAYAVVGLAPAIFLIAIAQIAGGRSSSPPSQRSTATRSRPACGCRKAHRNSAPTPWWPPSSPGSTGSTRA